MSFIFPKFCKEFQQNFSQALIFGSFHQGKERNKEDNQYSYYNIFKNNYLFKILLITFDTTKRCERKQNDIRNLA